MRSSHTAFFTQRSRLLVLPGEIFFLICYAKIVLLTAAALSLNQSEYKCLQTAFEDRAAPAYRI
jgi:hypothetical protein